MQSLVLVACDRLGDDEHSEYLATFTRARRRVDSTVYSRGDALDLGIGLAD